MSDSKEPKHIYDDIVELDNQLPRWWINLFYLTIVFAAGYFFYYSMGSGPTLVQEYEREKSAAELVELVRKDAYKPASEDELKAFVAQPEKASLGHGIFQTRCVSCHGSKGEGGIGPNLTDNYWIHGAKLTDLVLSVRQGVPDKGMPPWGPMLTTDEIHATVAYIRSIRGTSPAGAKAPQGDMVKE